MLLLSSWVSDSEAGSSLSLVIFISSEIFAGVGEKCLK